MQAIYFLTLMLLLLRSSSTLACADVFGDDSNSERSVDDSVAPSFDSTKEVFYRREGSADPEKTKEADEGLTAEIDALLEFTQELGNIDNRLPDADAEDPGVAIRLNIERLRARGKIYRSLEGFQLPSLRRLASSRRTRAISRHLSPEELRELILLIMNHRRVAKDLTIIEIVAAEHWRQSQEASVEAGKEHFDANEGWQFRDIGNHGVWKSRSEQLRILRVAGKLVGVDIDMLTDKYLSPGDDVGVQPLRLFLRESLFKQRPERLKQTLFGHLTTEEIYEIARRLAEALPQRVEIADLNNYAANYYLRALILRLELEADQIAKFGVSRDHYYKNLAVASLRTLKRIVEEGKANRIDIESAKMAAKALYIVDKQWSELGRRQNNLLQEDFERLHREYVNSVTRLRATPNRYDWE